MARDTTLQVLRASIDGASVPFPVALPGRGLTSLSDDIVAYPRRGSRMACKRIIRLGYPITVVVLN
jgi:hypothetical protein